jgi:hypothetical protein
VRPSFAFALIHKPPLQPFLLRSDAHVNTLFPILVP